MPLDLVANALLSAIAAGAASGGTDLAKKAMTDTYDGLKSLIQKKLGGGSDAVAAIENLEAKPDSEGRRTTLVEDLASAKVASDPEIVAAAKTLIGFFPQSHINYQNIQGDSNIQIGPGGRVNISSLPKAKDA